MSTRTSATAPNVLVLGREERAFLSVIRSFGRAGLNVHVGMFTPGELALRSRYIRRLHDIPDYQADSLRWVDTLSRILSETAFELVVPCTDHSVIPIQRHKEQLGQLARVYALDDEPFRIAFDKIESYLLAKELGVAVPRSRVITPGDAVDTLLEEFPLPVVLKPPSSSTLDAPSVKRTVMRARTRESLEASLRTARDWERVLVQENFIGVGVGVEVLAKGGTTLAAFQHERVHEPLEGGGSSYRRSTPLHPELLAASRALMEALRYTGVAMVEFKYDPRTGRWVFIEINGRFWGSLPLSIAAGADFPRYLYQMLVHGRTEFPARYRTNVYCRNVRLDVQWLKLNLASRRDDPTLATRPLPAVAAEVVHLLTLRERWDTLVVDDPGVGLVQCADALSGVAQKVRRLLRKVLVGNPVGRRLVARRTLARIRGARSVLFVCKGNICRSPFAAAYAARHLPPHIRVTSSGYYRRDGRKPPPAALMAAQKFGIELSRHCSTILDADAVAAADIVLVFDEHNFDTVRKTFPSARDRIFRLAGVLESGPLAIRDPYGEDVATFEAVYRQIVAAINRVADEHHVAGTIATASVRALSG